MTRTTMLICTLLLLLAADTAAIDLRLAAGAEIIPLRRLDLRVYNTGCGVSMRTDFVWGQFAATSIEMGYRRWGYPELPGDFDFTLHRFGLLQRFYPLFAADLDVSPYLGFGLTASNRDRFTLRLFSADYAGVTLFTGCEVPLLRCEDDITASALARTSDRTHPRLTLDPVIRWQFDWSTDYFYSSLSFGAAVVWTLF